MGAPSFIHTKLADKAGPGQFSASSSLTTDNYAFGLNFAESGRHFYSINQHLSQNVRLTDVAWKPQDDDRRRTSASCG